MSSGAVSYGSSPRKTLDLGSKVQAKEYVNQCLDDMPIKTWDGLWPLFRSGPAAHPVPWVAGEWNNEENFEQAATELLRKNVGYPTAFLLPAYGAEISLGDH